MEVKFDIKENSILSFLKENANTDYIQKSGIDKFFERNNASSYPNYHYLLAPEIFIKNNSSINIGEKVKFTLEDRLSSTHVRMNVIYLYEAKEYDDLSIRLVLSEKKVEPIENN